MASFSYMDHNANKYAVLARRGGGGGGLIFKSNIGVIFRPSYPLAYINLHVSGFSVTAPWAFIWFLDGNENKVDISTVGTNGKFFLINAHGVLRRMGAVTEIPGNTWKYSNKDFRAFDVCVTT